MKTTTMKTRVAAILAAMVCATSVVGMGTTAFAASPDTITSVSSVQASDTSVDNYIRGMIFDSDAVLARKGENVSDSIETKIIGDKFYVISHKKCTTEKNSLSSFSIINNINSVAYPGALLLANSDLANGNPSPIDIERSKTNLTIHNIGVNGNSYVEVDPSKAGNVEDAVKELVSRWDGKDAPAQISYKMTAANSKKQIEASLGISSDIIDKLQIDFSAIHNGTKNSVVMSYKQVYYSVSADIQKGEKAFGTNVTVNDLKNEGINEENPPVMVSSVDYGRMIYVNISSTRSETEIKAALEAAKKAAKLDVKVDSKYQEVLDECEFTVFALGGQAGESGKYLSVKNADEFIQAVSSENKFTENTCAAPISYSTRYLKDGKVASSTMVTDYTETTTTIKDGVKVTFRAYGMNGRIDNGIFKIEGKLIKGYNADGTPIYEDYSETVSLSGTTTSKLTLPANLDLSKTKITFDYSGTSKDSFKYGTYDLSKAGSDITNLQLELEGSTKWWGGYYVEGRVWTNNTNFDHTQTTLFKCCDSDK